MERETFENESIAELMNDYFVCIKVDREERPDIDKIYMSYVMLTTGSGGWPLSVFLTPSLQPIFGGTYFPPEDTLGNVGFRRIIEGIHRSWITEDLLSLAEADFSLMKMQASIAQPRTSQPEDVTMSCDYNCYKYFARQYDPEFGGFQKAPKFPQTVIINFLFTLYYKFQESPEAIQALEMGMRTLKMMARGGIHDHVGSGFSRYAVDAKWHVPHFEKMLYDQAQLANCFIDAYTIKQDVACLEIVEDIMKFVIRDLKTEQGGFLGAVDADSLPSNDSTKVVEGAYYVWTMDELRMHIKDEMHLKVFCYCMGIKDDGNVDPKCDWHNELQGKNVLAIMNSLPLTAEKFARTTENVKEIVKGCLDNLYEARQLRPKPAIDTKIITSWNGLMISALAKAGLTTENEEYVNLAVKGAEFIRTHLTTSSGSLLRCCYVTEGELVSSETPIEAYQDDYAFFIRALIDLYEATFDDKWLEWAEELQTIMHEKFWDEEYGAYFMTQKDDKYLIIRERDDHDGAEPCGNSVASSNLLRLTTYLNRSDLQNIANKIFTAYSDLLQSRPQSLTAMAANYLVQSMGMTQIFIVGPHNSPQTQALLRVVRTTYLPNKVFAVIDFQGPQTFFFLRNPLVLNLKMIDEKPTAYVCQNYQCHLPITEPEELEMQLARGRPLKWKHGEESSSSSDTD